MSKAAKVAYVFPGQGSQYVGMGRDLCDNFASARAVFTEADEVLGFPLSKLCFEGPEEELRLTVNAQPALVAHSLACLAAVKEATGDKILPPPAFMAGHSLGEYTALVVANVLDSMHIIYIARERGRMMQNAGERTPGSMVAIIGLDEAVVAEICEVTDTQIANYNCPGQYVVSGAKDKVDQAAEMAKAKGGRALPLQVSGAFHSRLMQSAADGMSQLVGMLTLQDPAVPIIANTSAQPLTTGEQIKVELVRQLCNGVQWQRSIEYMINNGVTTFIEIGAGKVLTGLIKRIDKKIETLNIGDVEAIKKLTVS
ncbi:MAG: ACP S-malonyltransferase [Chloroflexota bacterium]